MMVILMLILRMALDILTYAKICELWPHILDVDKHGPAGMARLPGLLGPRTSIR